MPIIVRVAERPFTDAQIDAAIEALNRPERFRSAEQRVVELAPQLQSVLAGALHDGGWFEAHRSKVREAAGAAAEEERFAAVETLLAEETRMSMLVGVAVGWELARELELPGGGQGLPDNNQAKGD